MTPIKLKSLIALVIWYWLRIGLLSAIGLQDFSIGMVEAVRSGSLVVTGVVIGCAPVLLRSYRKRPVKSSSPSRYFLELSW